jgi:DNA-binding NtrC family response regulator
MTPDPPKPRPPLDPHVLVVEDEPRMRDLLQRVLTGWGFDAAVARSAEEATKLAEARPPDVVVLDLNLPGEGGIEWFRRLREKHPNVQAIIVTGFASIEAAREAIHLDVVEFLTKPARLEELEQALDRALRRLAPVEPVVLPPEVTREEDRDDAGSAQRAGRTLEDVEREHILATLARQGGNRTATAAELGISRRTLYYKLEGYQRQGHSIE